ncbi:MAG: hypothetical protein K0R49_1457 [Burkholderiales bacterium]|nr:hypothetical protein [Burkholderiales bacterium]
MKTCKLLSALFTLILFIGTAKAQGERRPFNYYTDHRMDCTLGADYFVMPLDRSNKKNRDMWREANIQAERAAGDKIWLIQHIGDDGKHHFSTSFGDLTPKKKPNERGSLLPTTDGSEPHDIAELIGHSDPQMIKNLPLKQQEWVKKTKWISYKDIGQEVQFQIKYNPADNTWEVFGLFDFEAYKSPAAYIFVPNAICEVESFTR